MSDENGNDKKGWTWPRMIAAVTGALVAVSTIAVTWYTTIRAETKEQSAQDYIAIEKGYDRMKEAVNKLSDVQRKHSLWIVACQAKQEAQTLTKISSELEIARTEIARLQRHQNRGQLRDDFAKLRAEFDSQKKRRLDETKRKRELLEQMKGDKVQAVPPLPTPKGRKGN